MQNRFNFIFFIYSIMALLLAPYGYTQQSYKSELPQFNFPDNNLSAQEEALKNNPMLQWFQKSRKALSDDPYRPIYHFVNPVGKHNDPNGLCFWNGNWHLFYQAHLDEDPRAHWGHAVSKDLIHWRDLPLAIYPGPEEQSFSGSTLVEEDRVIAMYDGTEEGNMIAIANDPLLLNWQKLTGAAVISMNEELPIPLRHRTRIGDPFLWKENETYYAIIGHMKKHDSTSTHVRADNYDFYKNDIHVRANYLFKSTDLINWEYLYPFVENDRFSRVGDDGSCPYFLPIGDRHILLFFSHQSSGQYLLGDYKKWEKKFFAISHGKFNHGAVRPGGVHAPSATSDGKGGVIVIFNMNEAISNEDQGWNQIMTLPMRLTLQDDDVLTFEPAGGIKSLRYQHEKVEPMTLPANSEVVFDNIKGNAMEIQAEIDPQQAQHIELRVLRSPDKKEYTSIFFYKNRGFDTNRGYVGNSVISIVTDNASLRPDVISRPPETAFLNLENDENIRLRIFIDKSVVEVYANGKQYAAVRVYPGLKESTGVSILSRGQSSKLLNFEAWQMKNIWDFSSKDWSSVPTWQ